MSTNAISPLRQRMIEDMNAAQAQPAHAEKPHQQLQEVRRVFEALARHGHGRRDPPVPAAPDGEGGEHLQSQPHHDRAPVLVPRDAAAIGSCRRDLSHQRTPEDPVGDEPGRGQAPVGHGGDSQGSCIARSRLRRRVARGRGGPAQGWRYRQRAKHHSHRAGQGTQRPPRHAVARDARSAAAMVEGATDSLRYGHAARAALVVSWPHARKADDDPAAQSFVSPDG